MVRQKFSHFASEMFQSKQNWHFWFGFWKVASTIHFHKSASSFLFPEKTLFVMVFPRLAISEKSFSSLKRVKTYSTRPMAQERLRYLSIPSVENEETSSVEKRWQIDTHRMNASK